MARIDTLKLDHPRMPAFDLRKVGHKTIYADRGEVYELGLSGFGFDVSRPLSFEDLIAIRDWCNEVIAVDGASLPASELMGAE